RPADELAERLVELALRGEERDPRGARRGARARRELAGLRARVRRAAANGRRLAPLLVDARGRASEGETDREPRSEPGARHDLHARGRRPARAPSCPNRRQPGALGASWAPE